MKAYMYLAILTSRNGVKYVKPSYSSSKRAAKRQYSEKFNTDSVTVTYFCETTRYPTFVRRQIEKEFSNIGAYWCPINYDNKIGKWYRINPFTANQIMKSVVSKNA